MKTCTACKIEKPETEFSKDKSRKDGLSYICFICRRTKSRGWKAQRRTYVLGLRKPAGVVKRELDEQRNIVKYGKDVADILKTLGD